MVGRKTRSARGVEIDFDIITIKEQLAGAPKTVEVSARREYIDQKDSLRKRTKVEPDTAPVVETANVETFEAVDSDPIPESVLALSATAPVEEAQPFLIVPETTEAPKTTRKRSG
jgi:hypothetical protein